MNIANKFYQHLGEFFPPLIFTLALLATSGCQSFSPVNQQEQAEPAVSSSLVTPPVVTRPETNLPTKAQTTPVEGVVSGCQRELVALSKVNQRLYSEKKRDFNELMSNASVYTAVREDITVQTKETMDAFYKFKTQKICSDIEQAVRQALINRAVKFI